jgi:uncharacterized protein
MNNGEKIKQFVLITIGTVVVALGVLGIFLPILPTTPFLLLGAACYAKSSDRFYNLLLNNKYLGKYIRNYRELGGITLRSKIIALCMLWVAIGYSAIFAISRLIVRLVMISIALAVSYHILSMKTIEEVCVEKLTVEEDECTEKSSNIQYGCIEKPTDIEY